MSKKSHSGKRLAALMSECLNWLKEFQKKENQVPKRLSSRSQEKYPLQVAKIFISDLNFSHTPQFFNQSMKTEGQR